MFRNSELRQEARRSLAGKWWMAAFFTLIIMAVTSLVSLNSVLSQFKALADGTALNADQAAAMPAFDGLGFFMTILGSLVSGLIAFASVCFFLQITREDKADLNNLLTPFKNGFFGKVILLAIMQAIFVFLWTLLFIIPGIVKIYSYSMSYYIQKDNPEYSWKMCITRSREMMDGYKGKLFLLHLSFIGWAILCLFTLGIGYFFLVPYMQTSVAHFYNNLSHYEKEKLEDTSLGEFNTNAL